MKDRTKAPTGSATKEARPAAKSRAARGTAGTFCGRKPPKTPEAAAEFVAIRDAFYQMRASKNLKTSKTPSACEYLQEMRKILADLKAQHPGQPSRWYFEEAQAVRRSRGSGIQAPVRRSRGSGIQSQAEAKDKNAKKIKKGGKDEEEKVEKAENDEEAKAEQHLEGGEEHAEGNIEQGEEHMGDERMEGEIAEHEEMEEEKEEDDEGEEHAEGWIEEGEEHKGDECIEGEIPEYEEEEEEEEEDEKESGPPSSPMASIEETVA